MEQNQIDLSKISDIQLKAFAYDEMGKIEASQANLRIINQELGKRMREANAASVQANNPDAPVV